MSDEDDQQLYWDEDAQRYYKYDAEKNDYYTDDETRAADEAAAQEAAAELAAAQASSADADKPVPSPNSPVLTLASRGPSRTLSPTGSVRRSQSILPKTTPSAPSSPPPEPPGTRTRESSPLSRQPTAVNSPLLQRLESSQSTKAPVDNATGDSTHKPSPPENSTKAGVSQPSSTNSTSPEEFGTTGSTGSMLSRGPSLVAPPRTLPSLALSSGSGSPRQIPGEGDPVTKTFVTRCETLVLRDRGPNGELSAISRAGSSVTSAVTEAATMQENLNKEISSLREKS